MRKLHVSASNEYDVMIGPGLLRSVRNVISEVTSARKLMIVSDDNVYPLYGDDLAAELSSCGKEVYSHILPHGEASKNTDNYLALLESLAENAFSRKDCLISLGGGVTGDLGGFAAATYMRGIDLIQIPTSLLAAVDASVGGKTAVNLKHGKNLAGCFYQPEAVITDTDLLRSLPDTEYANGCAEVIKCGMIADQTLLELIMTEQVSDNYEDVICRCVDIKRGFVEADEYDNGSRMLLNFGHTFGHAFEKLSGFTLPHGFAVSAGMACVTRAAVKYGLCGKEVLETLIHVLDLYRLPSSVSFGADEVASAALADKKAYGAGIRLIVPVALGKCRILKLPSSELIAWIKVGETDD